MLHPLQNLARRDLQLAYTFCIGAKQRVTRFRASRFEGDFSKDPNTSAKGCRTARGVLTCPIVFVACQLEVEGEAEEGGIRENGFVEILKHDDDAHQWKKCDVRLAQYSHVQARSFLVGESVVPARIGSGEITRLELFVTRIGVGVIVLIGPCRPAIGADGVSTLVSLLLAGGEERAGVRAASWALEVRRGSDIDLV